MSSIHKAYSDATGKTDFAEEEHLEAQKLKRDKQNDIATETQIEWLNNPVTRNLFSKLRNDRDELLKNAINLAVAYPVSNNHNQIVHLLVRANEIDNIVKEHASIN